VHWNWTAVFLSVPSSCALKLDGCVLVCAIIMCIETGQLLSCLCHNHMHWNWTAVFLSGPSSCALKLDCSFLF
jgi:hypothetical protein